MFLHPEALYHFLRDRASQGGLRVLHPDNPLTCLLEAVLYLSVAYLLAAKVIQALLRRLSLKPHARDSCAEATLLGVSTAVCLFLCWTELRPRRDVHRRENSLVGVFTHNRLFDEYSSANPTNGRAVFASVSGLLLHAAGVTWYNHGLDLQVVKKTAFFAFYVAAHNLRFKCAGSAAALVVTLVDLVLQLTRVVCCLERGRSRVPILTYLSFATYVTAWAAVFAGVLPWFFLRPCLHRATPVSRLPPVCFLCATLFVFYVVEVATMPLVRVLRQWLLPAASPVNCGRLERVLIPPPARVLRELRELRAMRLRARATQQEFDIRHGSCKKTRDVYKSLKMIMAVKRRIRNFRQARLPASPEDAPTSTVGSEPSGDPSLDTASKTPSDLRRPSAPLDTASKTASDLRRPPPLDTASRTSSDLRRPSPPLDTASGTPSDLRRPSPPLNTASGTPSDLRRPSPPLDKASGTPSDLHQPSPLDTASRTPSDLRRPSPPLDTASRTPSDLRLPSPAKDTASGTSGDLHFSSAPISTLKESPSDLDLFNSPLETPKEAVSELLLSSRLVNMAREMLPAEEESSTASNRTGGAFKCPHTSPAGSRSDPRGESELALKTKDGSSGVETESTR